MNVVFEVDELLKGFIVTQRNGNEYVLNGVDSIICFHTTAGEGLNQAKIIWYKDKRTKRTYRDQKHLNQYISLVHNLSTKLYERYQQANNC